MFLILSFKVVRNRQCNIVEGKLLFLFPPLVLNKRKRLLIATT